jgi:uncharacterized protein YbaR (Trm112 family)
MQPAPKLDPKIFTILACPLCKGTLKYDKTNQELICKFDKLAYKIKDGIPVMIPELARKI